MNNHLTMNLKNQGSTLSLQWKSLLRQNPDFIINISASPFSYTKIEAKENIFRSKAIKYKIPVITVNQTGANTELIFDGASVIVNRKGEIFYQLPFFEEAVETFSFEDIISADAVEEKSSNRNNSPDT